MKPIALVPRSVMERKPPHGSLCTRCGACCLAVKCSLGKRLFGDEPGSCPAVWSNGDDTFSCLVVTGSHGHMHEAAKLITGTGIGCDARFNGEPADIDFYKRIAEWEKENATSLAYARRLWAIEG